MAGPRRILSIDGGGIRGIIPAMVLAELEARSGRPVAELFDLLAGTSTGGILALGLLLPGDDGRPRYRAADMVAFYEHDGPRIFHAPLLHRVEALGSLLDEKYPPEGLEEVLDAHFGSARLRDCLRDVIVTAYEIERRTPFFFKSAQARRDAAYDFAMAEVARATSAAPTYFPPARIPVPHDPGEHYALVDGGTFADNPAMCAYAEAHAAAGDDVVLLSLGTGELCRPIPYQHARDWGLLGWARPLLSVVFDGVSDTTDYELSEILGRDRYHRLQTTLALGSDDLDDTSPHNVAALKRQAEQLIAAHVPELDALAARLSL